MIRPSDKIAAANRATIQSNQGTEKQHNKPL